MEKIEIRLTQVYRINGRLVVANSIEGAINTWREWMSPSAPEIVSIEKVGNNSGVGDNALVFTEGLCGLSTNIARLSAEKENLEYDLKKYMTHCNELEKQIEDLQATKEIEAEEYKAGDFLYKLSHPSDDRLPEGGKRVFIYSGKTTADGYGVLFGFAFDSELCSSSGYGNHCYGGDVRYATEEEKTLFVKEVHLYDKPIKKY